jgi:hypothetical protein
MKVFEVGRIRDQSDVRGTCQGLKTVLRVRRLLGSGTHARRNRFLSCAPKLVITGRDV